MTKKASRSPSKGTKAAKSTTESPKSSKAVTGQPEASEPIISFHHGDSVELSLSAAVAKGCFTLATGADCPDSAVAIQITPPREGRVSTLTIRFVTPAAATAFIKTVKGD